MKIKHLFIAAALVAAPMSMAQSIDLHQLSPTNSLIKVEPASRYLLLPVEESMPDAKIDVLLDGNIVKTFYVRLAANRVDFKVPFDLAPYQGKGKLVLNILTPDDRAYTRDAGDNLLWSEFEMADTFDTANREKYRPAFHHTPLYGWMNDPNGMFYKDGEWHLYYQHNPYGSKWQNMTWGHSSSKDLVNWEHHPLAIEPNGLGTIFSGSAVVDTANTAGFGKDAIVALYTSAGASQIQSLAYSLDGGMTFTNYPGNPVITTYGEARDPNMFWNKETGKWNLLLAHALDHEMLIYSSPDLIHWTQESAFGKGYGCQAGVWECPDMFKLPVRGTDKEKWVLICNINPGAPQGGSAAQYFVGDFDGKTFVCDSPKSTTKWMDYGKDHYAAVSFSNAPDNRHTTVAWMSNWEYANEVPTMQYRSANALPRDHDLFEGADGELYLGVFPAKEVEAMRGAAKTYKGAAINSKGVTYAIPELCEIDLNFNPGDAEKVVITLSNEQGEKVEMTYDIAEQTFEMDRTQSGLTNFSSHFLSKTVAPTHQQGNSLGLRLFVDTSSIEAFDSDGRFAMTNLVFPTAPYTALTLRSEGGKGRLASLKTYKIDAE